MILELIAAEPKVNLLMKTFLAFYAEAQAQNFERKSFENS
jgi:hypothetical protein